MVKSVFGVNHQGLRDWMIQRITALILALSLLGLVYYFVAHPDFSFVEWRMLFDSTSVKILTLLTVLSFAFHAWIGIWTVVTDYIQLACLRFVIHVLVLLTLLACFFVVFTDCMGFLINEICNLSI